MLFIVNGNVDGFRQDEVLDLDPTWWADLIDAGWLQPVDEEGLRIVPVVVDERNMPDVSRWSPGNTTWPGDPDADLNTASETQAE